jgi:hypothetical protein
MRVEVLGGLERRRRWSQDGRRGSSRRRWRQGEGDGGRAPQWRCGERGVHLAPTGTDGGARRDEMAALLGRSGATTSANHETKLPRIVQTGKREGAPQSNDRLWRHISLRLGDELLDIVPVQRNWRFGAVEQNPNAAVNAATADNSAFPFGKARTTRRTECAHPEPGPNSNRRSRQAHGTLVRILRFAVMLFICRCGEILWSLLPHSLGPRNRAKMHTQNTIGKRKSRTSGMN